MKPFYADYVNHALKFYARNEQPVFKNQTDIENYSCVKRVLSGVDKVDAEILCDIFRRIPLLIIFTRSVKNEISIKM
jgi:hypothetical protein